MSCYIVVVLRNIKLYYFIYNALHISDRLHSSLPSTAWPHIPPYRLYEHIPWSFLDTSNSFLLISALHFSVPFLSFLFLSFLFHPSIVIVFLRPCYLISYSFLHTVPGHTISYCTIPYVHTSLFQIHPFYPLELELRVRLSVLQLQGCNREKGDTQSYSTLNLCFQIGRASCRERVLMSV